MTTRLDRLFLLLETGSTPSIRAAAAKQIGEVQKLHPYDLPNLLAKVCEYLKHTEWDTRIAGGLAVEAILKNVPSWKPLTHLVNIENSLDEAMGIRDDAPSQTPSYMNFGDFDISSLLKEQSLLVSSIGDEYETEQEEANVQERLNKQKELLQKCLSFYPGGKAVSGFMTSESLFEDSDLINNTSMPSSSKKPPKNEKRGLDSLKGNDISSRVKNREKRRVKHMTKQRSEDTPEAGAAVSVMGDLEDKELPSKRIKLEDNLGEGENQQEHNKFYVESGEWPLTAFCDYLKSELFHYSWENRHGAATGLREAVKLHGSSAGRTAASSNWQQCKENQQWLEDLAVRLVCVLTLDRFGDYVSDEVVAPVRETCAQTLGAMLQHTSQGGVKSVLALLMQLITQRQWEVRHGGLLGLKYLLAIRKDMTDELLPQVIDVVLDIMGDHDDDVCGMAAACLTPVVESLYRVCLPKVSQIIQRLWSLLENLDDLSASANSVIALLAAILSHPALASDPGFALILDSLSVFVPRLWLFLYHHSKTIRRATLQAIQALLAMGTTKTAWLIPILQEALRHIYQRCLLEENFALFDMIEQVWQLLLSNSSIEFLNAAAGPWLSTWLCLSMQSTKVPFDPAMLIEVRRIGSKGFGHPQSPDQSQGISQGDTKYYIGVSGGVAWSQTDASRDACVTHARLKASRLLGLLLSSLVSVENRIEDSVNELFTFHLRTKSATQRQVIGHIITEWASITSYCPCSEQVLKLISGHLTSSLYYDEVAEMVMQLQSEYQNLQSEIKQAKVTINLSNYASDFTIEQATSLINEVESHLSAAAGKPSKDLDVVKDSCNKLKASLSNLKTEQQSYNIRVQASLASSLVALKNMPEKSNPVVRPLIDSVKKEPSSILQVYFAGMFSRLLVLCQERRPCPNSKIIKNLCISLCVNPRYTPNVGSPVVIEPGQLGQLDSVPCNKNDGILSLVKQLEFKSKFKTNPSAKCEGPKLHKDSDSKSDREKLGVEVQRRGAKLALREIAKHFCGLNTAETGTLWDAMTAPLFKLVNVVPYDDNAAQELVNSLQVFEVLIGLFSSHAKVEETIPALGQCLSSAYTAVRHMAARCLGVLSTVKVVPVMTYVVGHVQPMMVAPDDIVKRQGAIEVMASTIHSLGLEILPFTVLLILPIMGRMSDQDQSVRQTATHCFATLVRLLPLESTVPDPPMMSKALNDRKSGERAFLKQLMDISQVENYQVPVPIKAELRKYQQDGVNWLAFLNKYRLHGILCDDMGLGKTLQTICIVASDHYNRALKYQESEAEDCKPLPSLVVCPPTLTGHWVFEVEKFISSEYLKPLNYTGTPQERSKLWTVFKKKKCNLLIVSYDILRNDIDWFKVVKFNYCILDEGHIIKNWRTKLTKAVKMVSANHRLILSGTPVQNNVLELWSLFDFLMPGFLGTEREFSSRYAKPILQSRDAKSSSREQEAGAIAIESLHKQVLPFLLRRLKEDVLDDLPPKIMQDYYCELSPIQVKLYDDFSKSHAKKNVSSIVSSADEMDESKKVDVPGTPHIFQALQYLRKLCNHPLLVVTPEHPEHGWIQAKMAAERSSLHDIQHSPKLKALMQLLHDCGIQARSAAGGQDSQVTETVVSQHRALVFCQIKSMLDIIENDLFKTQMPYLSYLRLDGSIPPGRRYGIVQRFNGDPSIDVLLLTTHVGGLGLNLTGADTVIFVEHDWNPMKDLQAMDRAHRIGQKKVVNVYRLITRGTIEEKIMGLQRFKLSIANAVITQENSSLNQMGTEQLLDLFDYRKAAAENSEYGGSASGIDKEHPGTSRQGIKAMMQNLGELWDTEQYEDEYDLDNFMKSLEEQ